MNEWTLAEAAARILELERALQETRDTITAVGAVLHEGLAGLTARVTKLENPPLTLERRRAQGELEGLTPGWPDWAWGGSPERAAQYADLAESDCPRCGHHGQQPRYYHRDEPRQFVSFAVCPACGQSDPF